MTKFITVDDELYTSVPDALRILNLSLSRQGIEIKSPTMLQWCRLGIIPSRKIGKGTFLKLSTVESLKSLVTRPVKTGKNQQIRDIASYFS